MLLSQKVHFVARSLDGNAGSFRRAMEQVKRASMIVNKNIFFSFSSVSICCAGEHLNDRDDKHKR